MKIILIFVIILFITSCAFNKGVYIKSFKMDVKEVTVAQFKECVKAGSCSKENFQTNSYKEYYNYGAKGEENNSMNAVYWYGAYEYCKWAGKRLPTEEEWKYAAKNANKYGLYDMSGSLWEWTDISGVIFNDNYFRRTGNAYQLNSHYGSDLSMVEHNFGFRCVQDLE